MWTAGVPIPGKWCNCGGQLFKPWPHRYGPFESARHSPAPMPLLEPGSSGAAKGSKQKKQKQASRTDVPLKDRVSGFETCYELLFNALAKLENLRALEYLTAPKYSGLNAVTPEQIKSHVHAVMDPTGSHETISRRRSDADIVYRLLAHRKLHFTEVRLSSELPLYENVAVVMPEKWLPDCTNSFAVAFRRLKRLDLAIDGGWRDTESKKMYKRLIRGSAAQLESLRIRFIHNPAYWRRFENIEMLWTEGGEDNVVPVKLPCLKHFELIFVENSCVEEISRHENGRWRRPPCVTLSRDRFWEPYLQTLTTLRLHHVVNCDKARWRDVSETMREDLRFLKEYPHKLEQVDWVVPAFRHHTQCHFRDDYPNPVVALGLECLNTSCRVYNDLTNPQSHLDQLIWISVELDIDLDPDTDTWNFGDYIRPDIEATKAKKDEKEQTSKIGW